MVISWVTVVNWLVEHGSRITLVLAIAVLSWFMLQRVLPPIVRRAVIHYGKGDSKRGIDNRTNTLVRVFTGTGRVLIFVITLFMVLSELGIPIGPVLAGFGVAGIAVGGLKKYESTLISNKKIEIKPPKGIDD